QPLYPLFVFSFRFAALFGADVQLPTLIHRLNQQRMVVKEFERRALPASLHGRHVGKVAGREPVVVRPLLDDAVLDHLREVVLEQLAEFGFFFVAAEVVVDTLRLCLFGRKDGRNPDSESRLFSPGHEESVPAMPRLVPDYSRAGPCGAMASASVRLYPLDEAVRCSSPLDTCA